LYLYNAGGSLELGAKRGGESIHIENILFLLGYDSLLLYILLSMKDATNATAVSTKGGHPTTGRLGMINVGNSCFSNATMQAVFTMVGLKLSDSMEKLRTVLRDPRYDPTLKEGKALNELACIQFYVGVIGKNINDNNIPLFDFGEQNDGEEFLIRVLDGTDAASKSLIAITRTKSGECTQCHRARIRPGEVEYCLYLEFPSHQEHSDIQKLLNSSAVSEEVTFKCESEECSGTSSKDTTVVKAASRYAVFSLKRFVATVKKTKKGTTTTVRKISNTVDVLLDVNFCGQVFHLLVILEHIGLSINSGHYKAHCRDLESGKFFTFDDAVVHETSEAVLLRSKNVYVLVYTNDKVHCCSLVSSL
jgi:uncharacterized UBP type Zn finger protein